MVELSHGGQSIGVHEECLRCLDCNLLAELDWCQAISWHSS